MKPEQKEKARLLRQSGRSVKSIAAELFVAQSSISVWTRDITLTEVQKDKLKTDWKVKDYQIKASLANKLKNEMRRNSYRLEGKKLAETSEECRLVAALYWGEGTKACGQFSFTNSDPAMVALVLPWLERKGFTVHIAINSYLENGLSENEILSWWEIKIGRRPQKWYNQNISRASQRKNIGKLPYGTCRLDSNIHALYLMLGAIDHLSERAMGSWCIG